MYSFICLFIQQPVTKCYCTKHNAGLRNTNMNNIEPKSVGVTDDDPPQCGKSQDDD